MKIKKLILFISILPLTVSLFSQKINSDIIILGHINVKDTAYTKFKISLFEKYDSVIKTTYSDSNSNYVLIIPREKLKGKNVRLITEDVLKKLNDIFPKKQSYCGISYPRTKYLHGNRTIKSTQIDTVNFIRYDFEPSLICYELRFPSVEFQENKLEMVSGNGETPDSVLRCLTEILQENPKFVMEISAHADADENEPEKIASFRGEMIKNMLICLGINPFRLVVKSYGCQRRLISESELKRLKSTEEKNIAKQRNRRVVFNVLRKDFVE